MKSVIIVLSLVFCTVAFADHIGYSPKDPGEAQVVAAKDRLSPFILGMKGMNMIGVTACEENNGFPFYRMAQAQIDTHLFVHCLDIGASDETALRAFKVLYPDGSKYADIFINSQYVGVIHP